MHDENYFSDPMEFIPERWLATEEKGSHTAKLESVHLFRISKVSLLMFFRSASFVFGFSKRCESESRQGRQALTSYAI